MADRSNLDRDSIHRGRCALRGCGPGFVGAFVAMLLLAAPPARGEQAAPETSEPDPAAVIGTLPFLDADEPNRIYVDLAKPSTRRRLRVLLDTGANWTVFTPRAAREIGVRPKRLKSTPYRRSTVLGRDLQFLIDTSSSDTASRTGWEYGLLGGNFLERYVLELDFPGRRIRFLDPDRYTVPETAPGPGEAVLPVLVDTSRPGVEVVVNGRPFTMLVDTGAPPGLMLSGEFASAAGVSSRRVEGFSFGGVHLGDMKTELGVVSSLRLGHFEFERIPVVVAPNGWFNAGYPGDSILGYDVLSQFTIRIDYPRRRMWLRRTADTPMTFLGQDASALVETLSLPDVAAPPDPR